MLDAMCHDWLPCHLTSRFGGGKRVRKSCDETLYHPVTGWVNSVSTVSDCGTKVENRDISKHEEAAAGGRDRGKR